MAVGLGLRHPASRFHDGQPVKAIKYYLESRGLERRDLEPNIASSGRVSEVLSYKRPLTLRMIRKLHAGLGMPLDVLINKP